MLKSKIIVPPLYEAELLTSTDRQGWFNWSLDFFTDNKSFQVPYVDITLQLDVTKAYMIYNNQQKQGGSFFAFLIWHLFHTMKKHPAFLLRKIQDEWFFLRNPPIMVPVAVGGAQRFNEIFLENVLKLSLSDFFKIYDEALKNARAGKVGLVQPELFNFTTFFGNLPNLRFTGLTLHYRLTPVQGQNLFYFGQRYEQEGKMYIPFSAKLHHATTDPLVLNQLVHDWLVAMS